MILVYDVSNRESFEHVTMWLQELEVYTTSPVAIVRMLVGNKIDIPERQVTRAEGQNFAREKQMLFIEASAKTRDGVKQAFDEVTHKIYETPELWSSGGGGGGGVRVSDDADLDDGGCAGCVI